VDVDVGEEYEEDEAGESAYSSTERVPLTGTPEL